jgi:multiple sugar transport system substrate-binding protein
MTTNGTWNVGTSLHEARNAGLNYNVAVLPHMGTKVSINTGGPVVVFNQSRHKQEAMNFIRWYSQAENSWDLISSGIWMPTQSSWYTNPELTRKWLNNPAYPPYDDFYSAVLRTAMEISRPAAWYYTPNMDEFLTLLGSVLGPVWTGQQTARDAITSNIAALRRAHAGN